MGETQGEPVQDGGSAQFLKGAEKLRETAKWLVATFGGLGAALITSLSFADLRQAEGLDLVLALVGFAIGLVGTVAVIGAAGRVLTTTSASTGDLVGPKADRELNELFKVSEFVLGGFASVDVLVTAHTVAEREKVLAFEAMLKPPDPQPKDFYEEQLARFERAEKQLKLTNPLIERALSYAAFFRLQKRFRQSLIAGAAGLLLAGAGIGLFAYFGSTPEKSEPGAAALEARPVEAVVNLNDEGAKTFRTVLGSGCDVDRLNVVVLAAVQESADLVTVPAGGCSLTRFTLEDQLGTLCPVDTSLRAALPTALPPDSNAPPTDVIVC